MPDEFICLSVLRGISTRAAALLDRYSPEQAVRVPAAAFRQFVHRLCWDDFDRLDLRVLDGLEPDDRTALIEELRAYNMRLRRQRERVDRFHEAYVHWHDERQQHIPPEYRERLHRWKRRYGSYEYYRVTGLTTRTGYDRLLEDLPGCMQEYERAFYELEQELEFERLQQEQAEANWWAGNQRDYTETPTMTRLEEALQRLELSRGATLSEIRKAYRGKAKALHPDRHGEGYTEQMAALNRDYAFLCQFYRSAASWRGEQDEYGVRSGY